MKLDCRLLKTDGIEIWLQNVVYESWVSKPYKIPEAVPVANIFLCHHEESSLPAVHRR